MRVDHSVSTGTTAVSTASTVLVARQRPDGFAAPGPAGSPPLAKQGYWSHQVEHVDTDASGVVHFARLASLFETACLERLHERGMGLSTLSRDGLDLVITRVDLSFHTSLRYRDLVIGEAWAVHVGGAAFHLAGRLLCWEPSASLPVRDPAPHAREVATGRLQLAVVDTDTGEPRPLPSDIREGLKGLLLHDR